MESQSAQKKPTTITLAGYVWEFYSDSTANTNRRALMMLGTHPRTEAKDADHLMTHSIWLSPLASKDPALTTAGAHVIVTMTYTERDGALPEMIASQIEPFDDRPTDEWRRYY